jgi:iron complex outermembrane receptor protein
VTGARYFTNAIDTRTRGVDLIANYGLSLGDRGLLRATAGYNRTRTTVTDVKDTPPELTGFDEALFGRAERGRIEVAQPRDNILSSLTYTRGRFGATVRAQRFGEVTNIQARVSSNQPADQTFGPKWLTDVNVSYRVLGSATFVIGSDNVFDVYPDEQTEPFNVSGGFAGNSNYGQNPYNGISPFGFNGRYVYTRLTFTF